MQSRSLAASSATSTKTFKVKAGRGRKVKLQALRRISLDVGAGESVAIVGESGSGKSTLLRVVAGLETPRGRRGHASRPAAARRWSSRTPAPRSRRG